MMSPSGNMRGERSAETRRVHDGSGRIEVCKEHNGDVAIEFPHGLA
jgi:hypothetical protein